MQISLVTNWHYAIEVARGFSDWNAYDDQRCVLFESIRRQFRKREMHFIARLSQKINNNNNNIFSIIFLNCISV